MRCEATLQAIKGTMVVRLPDIASAKLPSRGQVAVQGTINGHEFQTVLEPDGYGGHWMRLDERLQRMAGVNAGHTVLLDVSPITDWPEPTVPPDLEWVR